MVLTSCSLNQVIWQLVIATKITAGESGKSARSVQCGSPESPAHTFPRQAFSTLTAKILFNLPHLAYLLSTFCVLVLYYRHSLSLVTSGRKQLFWGTLCLSWLLDSWASLVSGGSQECLLSKKLHAANTQWSPHSHSTEVQAKIKKKKAKTTA